MADNVDFLIREFGAAIGLGQDVALQDGVLSICDRGGINWTLQCTDDAALLVLYAPLTTLAEARQASLESWLALNSRFDILRGAWLGLDPDGEQLCLLAALPVSVLTVSLLHNLFGNLRQVRAELAVLRANGDFPDRGPAWREPASKTRFARPSWER